ncbi:MAG: Crp/Fnr family transcriptional regulator [Lachnospiraceae bacterium]|nr:Crp/Fnr family transcriptional regulator [Lachnospiraceae bacterium]
MKDFFLFKDLAENEKEAVIKSLPEPSVFLKGDVICGSGNGCIGIMEEGTAKCFVKNCGVVMRTFKEGDIFGVTDLFGDNDVSTIVASSRCSVIFLERSAFQELLRNNPGFSMNYIRFLTDRICFLNRKISLYSMDDAEHKVYAHLLSISDDNGTARPGNMSLLARTLGIGRTSLYRAVEALENKDIISRDGKIYSIKELSL